jgi:hypothetical protein
LKPMTCRLRSEDEGEHAAPQATSDDVNSRNVGDEPDGLLVRL